MAALVSVGTGVKAGFPIPWQLTNDGVVRSGTGADNQGAGVAPCAVAGITNAVFGGSGLLQEPELCDPGLIQGDGAGGNACKVRLVSGIVGEIQDILLDADGRDEDQLVGVVGGGNGGQGRS